MDHWFAPVKRRGEHSNPQPASLLPLTQLRSFRRAQGFVSCAPALAKLGVVADGRHASPGAQRSLLSHEQFW